MKMKRYGFILFVMLILISGIILSCKKKSENTSTVERKKYAWVAGPSDSTGYGLIIYSADSGETWVRQGQGSAALKGIEVCDIWAVDASTVWAVCSENVVLRTLDGGQTWSRIQVPANSNKSRLSSISIVNKTNVWISGSGGVVYNSKDNGNTWKQFDTTFFHNGLMQGICAITPQKVYVAGGIGNGKLRGFIAYTLDGGATWDSVFPANDYNRNEWIGVCSNGNSIVVYGGKSHYMLSIDGGSTWKNDSAHASGGGGGADFNHMIMLNPQTWWGAMDMGHLFLTTDGGSNWEDQATNQGGEFMFGIDAWDSQLAITVGTLAAWPPFGPVLKTSDGGTHWVLKKSFKSNLNKVTFIKQ